MKKLILASMILMAAGAANAEVTNLGTLTSGTTPVDGESTSILSFSTTTEAASQPPSVIISKAYPNNVVGPHGAGTVAQYAKIVAPIGTHHVAITTKSVDGTNSEHAAVTLMVDLGNSTTAIDKTSADVEEGDTLFVGFVSKDNVVWSPGTTTGNATVTFYKA
ncbi:TPA: hypothetical protein ACS50F_003471 [Salmonella enterica]